MFLPELFTGWLQFHRQEHTPTHTPLFSEIFICKAYTDIFTHSFGKGVVFGNLKPHRASIVFY